MKKIGLKEAHRRLVDSVAVIVDNDALVYPSLADIENNPENEFLYLSWEEYGRKHSVRCMEQNNQTIKVTDDGALMILEDTEGDRVQLTLLQPADYSNQVFAEEVKLNCRTC
jgi:hypothetical protein